MKNPTVLDYLGTSNGNGNGYGDGNGYGYGYGYGTVGSNKRRRP